MYQHLSLQTWRLYCFAVKLCDDRQNLCHFLKFFITNDRSLQKLFAQYHVCYIFHVNIMLHYSLSLMNRLNKSESAIFVSLFWFGCSRGIDLYQNIFFIHYLKHIFSIHYLIEFGGWLVFHSALISLKFIWTFI